MLLAEENPVWPVRLVFVGSNAVIENGRFGVAALRDSIGKDAESESDRLATAVTEFHQSRKAERITVARPRAMELTVIQMDLLQH